MSSGQGESVYQLLLPKAISQSLCKKNYKSIAIFGLKNIKCSLLGHIKNHLVIVGCQDLNLCGIDAAVTEQTGQMKSFSF